MKNRRLISLLILIIMCLSFLPPAQAGYNPLQVSTYGRGIPVYTGSRKGSQAGLLYNGYHASLSLSPTNGMYSLNLAPGYEVWVDQAAAQSSPRQSCNAFLAELTRENAPLYTAPDQGRLTAKHAMGTLVTVWGEFGDYYYVQDYSYFIQGFFPKSSLRKIKDLSYDQAHSMNMGVDDVHKAIVYTDGLPLFRSPSATGYADDALQQHQLTALQDGQEISILARLGNWVQLADGGFIEARFLDPSGDHGHRYARVKSDRILDRLNVRSYPSTEAWVEAKLCAGTRVEVISQTDEWACIHVTGEGGGASYSGSVKLEFLALNESESVLDGSIPVRLKRAIYGGNYGDRYSPNWDGTALPAGTKLTIIGVEGNYGSASDDTDCFLALTEAGKLITIYDEGGIFEPLESSGQFAKANSSLKMRQAPGKDAKVLRTLSKGTKVEVLLRGEGWTMIRCKDQTGYVMSRYLNFP